MQKQRVNYSVITIVTLLIVFFTFVNNQPHVAAKSSIAQPMAVTDTPAPTPTDTVYNNSGMTASQSTQAGSQPASKAIDGDITNIQSFTQTNPELNPWLQIDLGDTRDVTKVMVYTRTDGCCPEKLNNTTMFLSNTSLGTSTNMTTNKTNALVWRNVLCNTQTTCTTSAVAKAIYTVTFPAGTRARYLRIQMESASGVLTVQEVVLSGIYQTNTPTPNQTGTAIANQTGTAIVNQTGTAIVNQTSTAIANQTGTAIANQTGTAIANQTGTAIVNQTNTAIVNQTGTAIANQTGTAIANQTGTATRLTQIAASWSPTPTKTNTRTIVVPTQPLTANTTSGQVIAWGNNAPYKLNAIPSQANSTIAQIAMGAHHALAVTSDGKLLGWGTNVKGELTIPAPAQTGVLQSAVGLNHSVVLKQDGTVVMWGSSAALTAPSGGVLTGITQIATGDNHTVMLRNNGTIQVYGASSQRTTIPTVIASKSIVGIAAGSDSSFALDSTGAVYAWGKSINIPILAAGSITRIFAAGNVYGALRSDGRLILFGSGVTNLVATGTASTLTNSTSGCPCMIIPSMDGVRNVSATQWGVIITRRSLQTQAYAYSGQSVPSALPTGILQLSTNPNHAIGIAIMPVYASTSTPTSTPVLSLTTLRFTSEYTAPGYLSIWGGDSTINSSIPTAAQGQLLQVVAGYRHISVLGTDGVVTSWGDNRYGQSTVPSELTTTQPLTDSMRVIALAAGANHSLALRRNGSVLAWGNNGSGQSNVPSNLLNVVSGIVTATSTNTTTATNTSTTTATNTSTTTATNTSTTTATNTNTTTATNTRTNTRTSTRTNTRTSTRTNTRSTTRTNTRTTTPIPVIKSFAVQLAAGVSHSVALLNDGSVQSWGDNTYGQLDQPFLTSIVKIAAGGWHTVALRRDNIVFAWGRNNAGQTDVVTYRNIIDIAASAENTILLHRSGRVIVIGQNDYEQRTIPAGLFQQIGVGEMHMLAITDNKQVVSWGMNSNGQDQVPTNLWHPFMVTGGSTFSAALAQQILEPQPTTAAGAPTAPILPTVPAMISPPVHDNLIIMTQTLSDTYNGSSIAFAANTTAYVKNTDTLTLDSLCSALPNADFTTQIHHVALGTYGMALRLDRTVRAWAPCSTNGTPATDITDTIPAAFQRYVAEIAVRGTHMMILTLDGRVWSNQFNLTQFPNIKHIAAGRDFAVVLLNDGSAKVTANNNNEGVATIPARATTLIEIEAGDYHILGLRADGQLVTWGANSNDYGQADLPYDATLGNVIAISTGERQSMALMNDGNAVAWGDYTADMLDALYEANLAHHITNIFTGNGKIAVFFEDSSPTVTIVPTNTSVPMPTMTARANTADFVNNQIAWYTMADFSQPQVFNGAPQIHNTGLTAKQSSVFEGHDANRAIDGNTMGNWYEPNSWDSSLAHTDETENPWWQVDLGSIKDISSVTVYNRTDCCMDRIDASVVFLSNTDLATSTNMATNKTSAVTWKTLVCDSQTACETPAGTIETATFPAGTKARYVRIQRDATGYLGLAEVVVTGNPVTFSCGSPQACPTLNSSDSPALTFNNSRNTELISSNSINLNGVSFTIRAQMRRDGLNRPDVIASLGNPSGVRQYLVLGVDRENRPYCSFYGDDLRSTSWYVDQEWHDYACSFDPTSRIRTLWRDAQIIGQDIVRGAFTPPAAPLIIGRRYDTMEGVTGELSQVAIFNRVLTRAELNGTTPLNESTKINGLIIETQLQSISPNGGTMRCDASNNKCPVFGRPEASSLVPHDGSAAIFSNNSAQQLALTAPASTSEFTVAFWANVSAVSASSNDFFMTKTNATGQGMSVGLRADSTGYMPLCAGFAATAPVIVESENAVFNRWYHFACSYNPTTQKLSFYMNAKLYSEATIALPAISDPLMLGYSSSDVVWPKSGFTGALDDVMLYSSAVSANTVIQIYNNTNPDSVAPTLTATACATPGNCPSPTATTTFTRTLTATRSPTNVRSKTPLAATGTATIPGFVPSNTRTRSTTPTLTRTRTLTRTPTISSTATVTATLPSATPFIANTSTATRTRTHLRSTQTMLARRSPTFYAQTQTARAVTSTPSNTATATRTATAYPLPPTNTPAATAYPTP